MLDLWLSAKSKLEGGGNRFLARTCSPPFPVHCSQELPLPTNTHPAPPGSSYCPHPPSGSSSSSLAAVQAQRFFFSQTLGWWVTTQSTLPMSWQLPALGRRVDVPRGHYGFWVVPIVLLGVRGVV